MKWEVGSSGHVMEARRVEPMVWLASAWVVGLVAGAIYPNVWGYLTVGVVLLIGGAVMWLRGARLSWVMVLAVLAVGGAWWTLHEPGLELERGLGAMIDDEGKLMCVEGVVREPARINTERPKGMASFMYSRPTTSFIVDVDTVIGDEQRVSLSGGMWVSMRQIDMRVEAGDRVRCVGWARRVGEPMNPGEYDFRAYMLRQGIVGRLGVDNAANVGIAGMANEGGWAWRQWRGEVQLRAIETLRHGMDESADEQSAALLEALVLGGRSAALSEVYESFQRTGLAHVLSISGMNVGILAGGIWWVVLVITGRPRWGAIAALGAAGVYLLVVPWQVPIVRAGFMTAVGCVGLMWSRRVSAMSVMSIIALVWLIARPGDLLDAGFVLSFGIVAALLLFTMRVARWMMPREIFTNHASRGLQLRRYAADYFAVSLVAWLVATPIIAYHFQMLSPVAVLINVLMVPWAAVMLWGGLLKVVLTMVWPWAAGVFGEPLLAMGRWYVDVVEWVAGMPGTWMILPRPSEWWVMVVLGVIAAMLSGWFAGRKISLVMVVLICVGWLYAPGILERASESEALRVNMLAVGDGSCYVVRSGGEVMVFDCGSGSYAQVGRYTIVPALRAMGVRRIGMLVVSHPDFDHFSGVLEVVDHVRVERIISTRHMFIDAEEKARGASAYLLEELGKRGMEVETIAAGWSAKLGEVEVEAIWPPEEGEFKHNNDTSIVMSFGMAGRRLLLCGDIQEDAMRKMLVNEMDLRADVAELPHHGSFAKGAVEWLGRVGPEAVLQSTGARRLQWDKWEGHLEGMSRHVTAEHGMVSLTVDVEGGIEVEHYRK